MHVRNRLFLAAFVISCLLPLAGQAATPHWVHYKMLNGSAKPPKKVIIMPASVKVYEVTAGGVTEEVPEWTNEASGNVLKSLANALAKDAKMNIVTFPRLPEADAANVDEHMALYKLVVNTASKTSLEHKIRRFDYTIGPGLSKLRSTGADAAIMVYGVDYASTAGRKAKAVLGNIPIINIFTGPPPELGHSFVHISVVDLNTGDLLWMNSEYRDGASNLRDYDDANGIIRAVFQWYPGIEEYRDTYVN